MSEDLRSEAWQLLEQANSQLQRGQYTDALATLAKAEKLARKAEAPDILSAVLGTTASVLQSKGMFDESLKLYTDALNIQEERAKIDPFFNKLVATTLNNLGNLLSDMGIQKDAKTRHERALEMRKAFLATAPQNSVYQSWVATTLNNLGSLLKNMGRPEDAKIKYERAFEMRKALLATAPQNSVYQSWVATTLNNLGNLLRDMDRPEDAKKRYEHAFKIYEALLATDPDSSVYQSQVATTLNNLGNLLKNMGDKKDALGCYQKSLGIYTKPMQYLTIKAKARAIINIIQLVSECAQEDTNIIHKSKYFKKMHDVYKQHDPFFSKYELVHERRLVKEAGLSAHIQYLMLNARSEENKEKRIKEYETCIREVEQIAETEDDENLKGLWSSIMYYLKGRNYVNMAMQFDPPDAELMKKAIEQFKSAKDRYSQANVCYCIYTVLLELESIEVLDDEAASRLKGLLKNAIESLPEKMDNTVKSAFHEIEVLLDDRNLKTSPEMFERLNACITKIDYYALREHFSHIACKIRTYLEEPFNPEVKYSNWTLHITFDEPEKVQGKLTIKAGDRVVFDEPLRKRNLITPDHRSEVKSETITFITEKNRDVTRERTYSEKIMYDGGHLDVHFLEHDCKRGITDGMLNIAIVQLKYHLNKAGSVIIIEDNDVYSAKLTQILDAVKGETDLIVFPEYSIPAHYLPAMKQYSDENSIVIVAGSHYITDENLVEHNDMFHDKFGDNDLRKNISPVIIPTSDKIHHTEKILPAKEERKLFNEEGLTKGSLNRIFKLNNNVTFGVIICFDFINDDLRKRITDACDVILIPQTNPGTERFHKTGHIEIDNTRGAGNKAYVMASGIFTYGGGENMMGGDSGVIMTLDKDSYKERKDAIIETIEVDRNKVYEQFIQMAQLNMKFNPARDTQMGQVPITYKLIHIFEENEMLESAKDDKKDDRNPQAFLELLRTINSCDDRHKLKQLLVNNSELIRRHSPLMHKTLIQKPSSYKKELWNKKSNAEKIKENLANLKSGEIKKKCASIVLN